MNNKDHERLTDLLADRATQNLSAEEQRELNELLAHYPDIDATEFDRAAAAIQLTEAMPQSSLPNHLKKKIVADAQEFFGFTDDTQTANPNVMQPAPRQKSARNFWQWAGWYAAAACFIFALLMSWPRVKEQWDKLSIDRPVSVATLKSLDRLKLELAMMKLRIESKDTVQNNWSPANYPGVAQVQGDVVWSSEKQQGYMRFKNLAANDPNQSVYQLWIFDANQDEKYPVDGGVFNVSESGEIIVPINAKLKITKPTLFAVTIEKPGGVVVSKRDKLILTAKIA